MKTKDCYACEDSKQCGDKCLNCDNCDYEPECPVAKDPIQRELEGKYCPDQSLYVEAEMKAGRLKIVGRSEDVLG